MQSYSHLSEDEREQIVILRAAGQSMGAISLRDRRSMLMRAGRNEKSFGWQYVAECVRPREGNETISTFGKLIACDE